MRFAEPRANIRRFALHEGMRVADFGAGVGACTFPAAEQVGNTGRVYAIDLQQDLLRAIKNRADAERIPSIEVIWGDIEARGGTALPDESVNRVIISNVLFLVRDKRSLIQEASRILKKGGKVLLVDWKDSYGGIGPWKESIVTQKEAAKLFKEEGFEVEEEFSGGAHHYGSIFKKA